MCVKPFILYSFEAFFLHAAFFEIRSTQAAAGEGQRLPCTPISVPKCSLLIHAFLLIFLSFVLCICLFLLKFSFPIFWNALILRSVYTCGFLNIPCTLYQRRSNQCTKQQFKCTLTNHSCFTHRHTHRHKHTLYTLE